MSNTRVLSLDTLLTELLGIDGHYTLSGTRPDEDQDRIPECRVSDVSRGGTTYRIGMVSPTLDSPDTLDSLDSLCFTLPLMGI